jgi:hypothetical protein
MADQHNDDIPVATNTLAADVPDMKENLGWHKDVFEVITGNWSNVSTDNIVPSREVHTISSASSETVSGIEPSGIRRLTLIVDGTYAWIRFLFNSDTSFKNSLLYRWEYDGGSAAVGQTTQTEYSQIILVPPLPVADGVVTYLIQIIFGISPSNNKNAIVNFVSSAKGTSYYAFAHGVASYEGTLPITSYKILSSAAMTGTLLHERLA